MSCHQYESAFTRRDFLSKTGLGIGAAALAQMLGIESKAESSAEAATASALRFPNFAPKAKRVICLFQSGGPSHLDLLDYKPVLSQRFNEDLPDSVRQGQRITGMVASQSRLALQP